MRIRRSLLHLHSAAAVAVDELGHPIFFDGVVALVRALPAMCLRRSSDHLPGHGSRRSLRFSVILRRKTYVGRFRG